MCLKFYWKKHILSGVDDSKPIFDLNNYQGLAKITSVYDGDTFNACIYKHGRVLKFKFRTIGYDSPEIKPPLSTPDRQLHIQMAKQAREQFKSLCGFDDRKPHNWWNPFKFQFDTNGLVWVKCKKNDKYGRVLVEVYRKRYDKHSVNEKMLASAACNDYDGGKKSNFNFI